MFFLEYCGLMREKRNDGKIDVAHYHELVEWSKSYALPYKACLAPVW